MRLLAQYMTRRKVDPNVVQIISMIFFWGLLILIFMTALGMLKIPITHLAFITGAIAVGVGFGSQNVINNLISGWILMSEKPVRIDDIVELDQHLGRVERVGNRSTRIRRIDGVHVLVPNSQLLERVVVNWTLLDRNFRSFVRVGVEYGSPVRRVEQLMHEAAVSHKNILNEPAPVVVFEDFGDNSLVFDLFFWCEMTPGTELRLIRSDIRFMIEELFRENGIVVAFPQRDVHLDVSGPIEVRMDK
jgi:small-conductance mechanosensitive channel